MARYAIGVDIGGTNLRAARVAEGGRIVAHRSESITRDPDVIIARIMDLCRDLDDPAVGAIASACPGESIRGGGRCCPGVMSTWAGATSSAALKTPWKNP